MIDAESNKLDHKRGRGYVKFKIDFTWQSKGGEGGLKKNAITNFLNSLSVIRTRY